MTGPLALLVTRSDDNASVRAVGALLEARGVRPVRLDTDLYPERVALSSRLMPAGAVSRRLRVADGVVDLNDVAVVWYRRFLAGGGLPQGLGDLRPPSVEEARRTTYGAIAALGADAFDGVPQLDPLAAVRRCDHKELQLRRAQALGLRVPDTLITNDADEARAFVLELRARGRQTITKMQSSFAVWRGGEEHVVFTSVVDDDALSDLAGLRYCPMQFQELLPKRVELRATVVGDNVFCAAIDSQRDDKTKLDWRKDGVGLLHDWVPYALPADVEKALVQLVHSFGLGYAAADFVVTADDELVFLEVNAGGEWYWLDAHCQKAPGLPIADAIAAWLARAATIGVPHLTARP